MQVGLSRNDHACTVFEGVRPTELWCLVFHHQYPHWYPPHVSLRFGERPSKHKLFCSLTDYRPLAGQLLWCGASSSLVGTLLINSELVIHSVSNSLFHDVGRLGYGRYVLSACPQRYSICNMQLQRYAAHIRPVAAHISGRPCFPSLEVLPSRPGLLVGSTFWDKLR
jgi:hypothetical protein